MSDNYFGATMVYKIRQARSKRQMNPLDNKVDIVQDKNQVKFFLNYQQCEQSPCKKRSQVVSHYHSKIKQRDRVFPFPKMSQNKQAIHDGYPPKKISVNFQLFNPKKKMKEEGANENTNKVQNFEEVILMSKEKYYEKVQKLNKKKTQKCRELSHFGLNIRTIERSEDCDRSPKKADRIREYTTNKQMMPVRRNSTIQTAGMKKSKRNLSQNRQFNFTRQKSKECVETGTPSPEKIVFKTRVQKMVKSNNLVLLSYGYHFDEKEAVRDGKLKYYVGMGNNRSLIVSILRKRWWWAETNEPSAANFVWTQLRHKSTIQRLQKYDSSIGQFPNTSQILNLPQQKNKNTLFKLRSHFFHDKLKKRLHIYLTQSEKTRVSMPFKQPECTHNHFSHNFMFGNKNALFQNLTTYYNYIKEDVYSIIPMTFFVEGCNSKKFQQFSKNAKDIKNAIWIVKPGQNSNRGNGIFVAKSVEQIKQRLSRKKSKHTYIIQKYITDLFLYQKRKFDIRTYMLLVSIGGVSKCYWYSEGYIRTSSQIFDPKQLSDFFIHLTNDAVQIKSDNYGKYQAGNKISFGQFQHYLDANCKEDNYSVKKLNQQMKKIATLAVKAVYNRIDPKPKVFSFQMFGLDFIIDEDFRPWLIEINTNPSLQLNSPVVERIIPEMIENMFRTTIDTIFQPTDDCSRARSYFLYENCLQKNKFELIFDSLFDRDEQWEEYLAQQKNRVEEGKNQFDNQGDQVLNQ